MTESLQEYVNNTLSFKSSDHINEKRWTGHTAVSATKASSVTL